VASKVLLALTLAICLAGSTSIFAEARTRPWVDPETEAVVTLAGSSVINLAWEADVKVGGGVFRLFVGQEPTDMILLAEVEAESGRRSYRYRKRPPSTGGPSTGSLRYELRYQTPDGIETSLASVIVIERGLKPTADVGVYSNYEMGVLGSQSALTQTAVRLPSIGHRIALRYGSPCPPPPPP